MEIYTDGSCINTVGGAGFAVIKEAALVCDGYITTKSTTNNRMELSAIICAFELIAENNWTDSIIYTDSQYCQKGYTLWMEKWIQKRWKKSDGKDVINVDLWKILKEYKTQFPNVLIKWVKGHDGNVWNEHVDILAKKGVKIEN